MSDKRKRVTIRGTFHALIVVSGWALFVYWWDRVIPEVDSGDATVAVLFSGATALATVLITLLWVRYNIGIFRRKGPRTHLVPVTENHGTDVLGRKILLPGPEALKAASHVVISADGETKKYETTQAMIWTA